ncbi:unnamed protein product [Calypogeia fissa]
MCWQMFLADFDFEVHHILGKVNAAADALSRKECHRANSILMLETKWPKVLAEAYKDDRIAQEWQRNGGKRGSIRHVLGFIMTRLGVGMGDKLQCIVVCPEMCIGWMASPT